MPVTPECLELLQSDLQALHLSLPVGAPAGLLRFLDLVLDANQTMNLTAITDPVEAVHKHLSDSLAALQIPALLAQVPHQPVWADVGSGAGFPGLALALAVPEAQVHLIESTGKKAHFLEVSLMTLGLLKQVQVHNSRAELLGLAPAGPRAPVSDPEKTPFSLRNRCDAVFFRGVSRLNALIELGAPLLKLNGLLIAYKGPKADEELTEASKAMKELKLELLERRPFELPGVLEARVLLCLQKKAETPKRFPRPVGLAQKEPLI